MNTFTTFAPASKTTFVIHCLERWFKNSPNGFYKFTEPCKHRYYRKGDSWIEEGGFCRRTFNTIFDSIGIRYKSKTQFISAKDKFKGKLYISYYDRDTNQTFYLRNHKLTDEFIKSNKKTKRVQKSSSAIQKKMLPLQIDELPLQNGNDSNSSGGTIGGYINIPSSTRNTTLERRVDEKKRIFAEKGEDKQKAIAVGMKKTWEEEIGDFGTARMHPSFYKSLYWAFVNLFDSSWDKWREYCRQIASSKFLMGEGNNRTFKKIWITWAIQEEVIERIKNGDFGLNTRIPPKSKHEEDLRFEEQSLQIEKIKIENSIEIIQTSVEGERRKTINDHMDGLTESQREGFKAQFVEKLRAQDDELLRDCGEKLWQNKWGKMRFEWFIREQITAQLFEQFLEEEVQQRLKQTNLLTELKKIEAQINDLTPSIISLNEAYP